MRKDLDSSASNYLETIENEQHELREYKGPERRDGSDGYLQAVEKGQDDAREVSRLLREFLGISESLRASDLAMVKELIVAVKLAKKTLRDETMQAALTGLLAAGDDDACSRAYQYADTALHYRNESKDE